MLGWTVDNRSQLQQCFITCCYLPNLCHSLCLFHSCQEKLASALASGLTFHFARWRTWVISGFWNLPSNRLFTVQNPKWRKSVTRLHDWFVTSFPAQQRMCNYSVSSKSAVTERALSFCTSTHYTWLRLQQGRDRNRDVYIQLREVEFEEWIEARSWRIKASGWSCDNGAVSLGSPGLGRLFLVIFFLSRGSGVYCGCFQPKEKPQTQWFPADRLQIFTSVKVKQNKTVVSGDSCQHVCNQPHQNTDNQNHGVGAGIAFELFFVLNNRNLE